MFIRKVYKKNPGSKTLHVYFRLVESYRSPDGHPRQRVLLSLGKLEGFPEKKHKLLADRIESLLLGQTDLGNGDPDGEVERLAQQFYQELLEEKNRRGKKNNSSGGGNTKTKEFLNIDINSLQHEDVREVGAAWVGKQILEKSGVSKALEQSGIRGAALEECLIAWLSRLTHPASELATAQWLKDHSGLCELFGRRPSQISRFHLYDAAVRLYRQKDMLERYLSDYSRDLFSLQDSILLFDLTNTYFEGQMNSSLKARHGRSKQKRSDAPLISLALVVDHLGFPKRSHFYQGNISEPKTLQDLLKQLEAWTDDDRPKPIIVMDAGIATEDNLSMLRNKGYRYLCVSRRKLRDYEACQEEVREVKSKSKNGYTIRVKDLASDVITHDRFIYVKSPFKEIKENAILQKLTPRFLDDLKTARAALFSLRGTKKISAVHQRLGRIKQKHRRIAKQYRIECTEDAERGIVTDIKWFFEPAEPRNDQGIYFIRTCIQEMTEEIIWQIYSTLTEIESAFRTLKTDLSIRPIYHQTDKNIEAHFFLGILSYHLVALTRYQLKQKGIHLSWKNIIQSLDSQKIITTTYQDDKQSLRYIRQCSRPIQSAIEIIEALNLKTMPFTKKKGVVTTM